MLYKALGVMPQPVYCTKIASRLTRTYTDKHGLKDLVRDVLGKDISKQQQLTDWGAEKLTEAQVAYAADDVLHLHALKEKLDAHAGARGPQRTGRGLLPVPARPRPARPRRLGRGGHFRAFLSTISGLLPAATACGQIRRRFSARRSRMSADAGSGVRTSGSGRHEPSDMSGLIPYADRRAGGRTPATARARRRELARAHRSARGVTAGACACCASAIPVAVVVGLVVVWC